MRVALTVMVACAVSLGPSAATKVFDFRHHFIDRKLDGRAVAQTALVDIDGDRDLDFVLGYRGGDVLWYEYRSAQEWVRHRLGGQSPSDVGGAALDMDRDGHVDFVAGGVWYRNSGKPRAEEFARHVFDAQLRSVHDIIVGDIDGDGRDDVITMSDKNDLRWYRIPAKPTKPWRATRIGEPVHSGISLGDLDRDGDLDVVRSNVWMENSERGAKWTVRLPGEPSGATVEGALPTFRPGGVTGGASSVWPSWRESSVKRRPKHLVR